jgi:hypothetical protein
MVTEIAPELRRFGRADVELVRRFEAGAVCFLARREGQVVGQLWISTRPYTEPFHRAEFSVFPAGQAAWDFDMAIVDDARNGFVFARLWEACRVYLSSKGVRYTYSRVSAFNAASLRAHARLGMMRIHTMTYLSVGSIELMVANVAPYVCVSWSNTSVPRVTLGVESK